jgi:hypothetical protein
MRDRHKTLPALKWVHCDLITGEGVDSNKSTLANDAFDLVIDKGTFDAVLVEGTVWPMLQQIFRLVKPGGAYVICSLNTEEFLQKLLSPRLIGIFVQI